MRPRTCRPRPVLDDRVALVELVHALAFEGRSDRWIAWNPTAYAEAARRHLKGAGREPAVALYRKCAEDGLEPIMAFKLVRKTLSPSLGYEGKAGFWSPWGDRGRDRLEKLLKALCSFAQTARVGEFFESRRAVRQGWLKTLERDIARRDYVAWLEKYSGLALEADYEITVCPLLKGATSSVEHAPPPPRVDTFWGPSSFAGGEPDFEYPRRGAVVWHELGHVLLDALCDEHAKLVARVQPKGPLERDGYGTSWPRRVRESAAQGLANRLLSWSKEQGLLEEGVPLRTPQLRLEAVERRLKEFEKEKAKDLKAFYPRLLEALGSDED